MLDKSSSATKKPIPIHDLLASGGKVYERSGGGRVRNYCRVALRHKQTVLAVILTKEIAEKADIVIGKAVNVIITGKTLTLVAADDGGAFTVRDQGSESGRHYPYVLLPVGAGKPLTVKFESKGAAKCEHKIDDKGRLVLTLPKSVELKMN